MSAPNSAKAATDMSDAVDGLERRPYFSIYASTASVLMQIRLGAFPTAVVQGTATREVEIQEDRAQALELWRGTLPNALD